MKKILVAQELAPEHEAEDAAVLAAALEAANEGSEIRLVHVLEPLLFASGMAPMGGPAPTTLTLEESIQAHAFEDAHKRLKEIGDAAGIAEEHQHVFAGRPADEIHRLAEEMDATLIVIGSHGRHGWRLLLGSTANAVLHGAPCSVLAVRVGQSG